MAQLLLNKILNSEITVERIINWLITEELEDAKLSEVNSAGCSRDEFVLYFLNFIRNQSASVLQTSNNAKQTSTKTTQSPTLSIDGTHNKSARLHRQGSLFGASNYEQSEPKNVMRGIIKIGDLQIEAENKSSNPQTNVILPESNIGTIENQVLRSSVNKNIECFNYSNARLKTKDQDSSDAILENDKDSSCIDTNVSEISHTSSHSNTNTSTPVIKRRVLLTRVSETPPSLSRKSINVSARESEIDFSHSSPLQSKQCDPLLLNRQLESNYNDSTDSRNTSNVFSDSDTSSYSKNISAVNNFIPNKTEEQSDNLNISLLSKSSNKNECDVSLSSRDSTKNESQLNNSLSLLNEIHRSPVSPLYISNTSMSTPKSSKKLYSRCLELPQNVNNNSRRNSTNSQQTVITTPQQDLNNLQKNVRSTPRKSLSLGDFMIIDARTSKKGSAKKNNARMQLLRHNEDENQLTTRLAAKDDAFPEPGKSSGRKGRRINPTRLDLSDDKGNKENAIFGTINRPSTANPQFTDISPTDKSLDETSFEVERDLLRLERQKQQKNVSISETDESSLSRTLSKTKVLSSTVTPNIEFVENMEALNILARLYSSFLDHNLVPNPMTELYFIISLITLQYSCKNNRPHSKMERSDSSMKRIEDTVNTSEKLEERKDLSEDDKALNTEMNACFIRNLEDFSNKNVEKNIESSDEVLNKFSNLKILTSLDTVKANLGCTILMDDVITDTDKEELSRKNSNAELIRINENLEELSLNCDATNFNKKNHINISTEYFWSLHNCVYFATNVLNNQRILLKILDRATLKLLGENNRIATFKPELRDYLNELYNFKCSESSKVKQLYSFSAAETNVCFQIDTDNRENFPSAITFQTFRKQRDLFYEILKIWEENHLTTGWVFPIALGGKIKTLLTLHNDATNYYHFARLFKSQLLISCIRNGQQEDTMDDESLSFLKSLKHLNPEKLTQLRERLVTPLSSKGPVPPPTFPGVQEFYKNFILYTFNLMFYVHLENCLVHEIMELNDTQFTGSEIEDTDTMVDERAKQNFITCLSSLRLLAKILGFLVSLPYRSELSTLEGAITSQIELRSRILPSLNLQYCLRNAISEGKLSLTIPWIVKYLVMLDPVSLRLPYYKSILKLLYRIYCQSSYHNVTKSDNFVSQQIAILIKFTLGWLFELLNITKDLHFTWQSHSSNKELEAIYQFDKRNVQNISMPTVEVNASVNSTKQNIDLDKLDMIDDRILYMCCPFLTELKILLTSGNASISNSNSSRHITPVSSELDKPVSGTSAKHLELQLEEAFFHSQPASTRKSVDFISERVASSCVKYICNSLLPSVREKNVTFFKSMKKKKSERQKQGIKETLSEDTDYSKSMISKEVYTIAIDMSKDLKEQCEQLIPPMCETRITKAVESLLAEDALPAVKEMCTRITNRMATERINQWIQSHIVGGSLFIKDLEMGRVYKCNVLESSEKKRHNVDAACPTNVIETLRSSIWELMDNKGVDLTLNSILDILDGVYQSLTERADLVAGPEKIIQSMSVDFALFLAAYRMDLFTTETYERFISIWKINYVNVPKSDSILTRILSPRNIMLLAQPEKDEVWLLIGQFLRRMLKENVLSIEVLSDQCIALFRHDWPTPILKHLSKCIAEGITDFESSDEQTERIKSLLVWVIETYREMEFRDQ